MGEGMRTLGMTIGYALAASLLAPAAASAAARKGVAVIVVADKKAPAALARAVDEQLTAAIRSHPSYSPLPAAGLRKRLRQPEREAARCKGQAACLAKLGKKAGAAGVLVAQLAGGKGGPLTLTWVEVASARAQSQKASVASPAQASAALGPALTSLLGGPAAPEVDPLALEPVPTPPPAGAGSDALALADDPLALEPLDAPPPAPSPATPAAPAPGSEPLPDDPLALELIPIAPAATPASSSAGPPAPGQASAAPGPNAATAPPVAVVAVPRGEPTALWTWIGGGVAAVGAGLALAGGGLRVQAVLAAGDIDYAGGTTQRQAQATAADINAAWQRSTGLYGAGGAVLLVGAVLVAIDLFGPASLREVFPGAYAYVQPGQAVVGLCW